MKRREPFLLACRWYDRECAGYLVEQDLEDLLLATCPALSRACPLSQLPALTWFWWLQGRRAEEGGVPREGARLRWASGEAGM